MDKRAQITYFILIGIVILGGILFYVSQQEIALGDSISAIEEDILSSTPIDARPIFELGQACLYDAGKDALLKIGSHGGYIDTGDMAADGTQTMLQINAVSPTDSEGVSFGQGNDIAYWTFIRGEPTCRQNCVYDSKRPALTTQEDPAFSIQSQMERYVKTSMQSCMEDGLVTLKQQGMSVQTGEMDVQIIIADRDVRANVEYPIHAIKDDKDYDVDRFVSRWDVRLRDIYNQAKDVSDFAEVYNFFEINTLTLISSHSGLGSGQLPPLGDSNTDPAGKHFWTKYQVQQQMQDILTTYIPLFQVSPSLNYEPQAIGNDMGDAILKKFVMPLGGTWGDPEAYEPQPYWGSLDVEFSYLPLWPIYLDIRGPGVQGELIGPESVGVDFPMLSFIADNTYRYYYTVGYPVLTNVHDPQAFGGEGYTFNFGIEVNLLNNLDGFVVRVDEDGNLRSFAPPVQQGVTQTCNTNQRNSHPITIRTTDVRTGQPVDDTQIMYQCGQTCNIGLTTIENRHAEITSAFPICVGGILQAKKYGYASQKFRLNTFDENVDYVEIPMHPLIQLDYEVFKYRNVILDNQFDHNGVSTHRASLETTPMSLARSEQAIVTITPSSRNTLYGLHPIFLSFTGDRAEEKPPLEIAPGEYDVTIQLIDRRSHTISPRWSCRDMGREQDCVRTGETIPSVGEDLGDIAGAGAAGGAAAVGVSLINPVAGVGVGTGIVAGIVASRVDPVPCAEVEECYRLDGQNMDQFYKGTIKFNWTVTQAIYSASKVKFYTIASPDGYTYDVRTNTTNLLIMDVQLTDRAQGIVNANPMRVQPRLER